MPRVKLRNVGIVLVGVTALSMLFGAASTATWTVDDDDVWMEFSINNPGTKTHFEGTVLENNSVIGQWHFVVSVDKWIGGLEPCSDPIDVYKKKRLERLCGAFY